MPNATTLWTAAEFDQELIELARDEAPRRFALCQILGDREDGRVFAWGLEHSAEDGTWAQILDTDGRMLASCRSADSALRMFSRVCQLTLIWIDPERPADDLP